METYGGRDWGLFKGAQGWDGGAGGGKRVVDQDATLQKHSGEERHCDQGTRVGLGVDRVGRMQPAGEGLHLLSLLKPLLLYEAG